MDLMMWLRNQWDRAGAAVAIFIGVLALVLGWVGVSGTGLTAEQIPYVISGGIGGLFLLGLGAMLWLSADMRDEWRAITHLRQAIDRSVGEPEIAHVTSGSDHDGSIGVAGSSDAASSTAADRQSRRRPLRSAR